MVQEAADRASKYQTEKKEKNTYQTEVIGFILNSKGISKNLYFCGIEVKGK